MSGMDDELDTLYSAPPDQFTAQRTDLAKVAKQRGDAAAAQRISTARRPTTAAWLVNRLAISDPRVRQRLTELGDNLRDAHAAMDGDRIREFSAQQHRLIDALARAAFDSGEVHTPSSALRDDVAGTLQAAVADPDVAARLGRLTKAERWSGFGEFGDVTAVSTSPRSKPAPASQPDSQAEAARQTEQRRREQLRETLTAAERAQASADHVLTQRQADRDEAAQRRDEVAAALRDAERDLREAEKRCEKAHHASRTAAEAVKRAKAELQSG